MHEIKLNGDQMRIILNLLFLIGIGLICWSAIDAIIAYGKNTDLISTVFIVRTIVGAGLCFLYNHPEVKGSNVGKSTAELFK